MAIVRHLEKLVLERDVKHSDVEATYSIIKSNEGKFLQIDTYGSSGRQIAGKKSQSLRLSEEALKELAKIIEDNDLI